jgi:hypothetical protein
VGGYCGQFFGVVDLAPDLTSENMPAAPVQGRVPAPPEVTLITIEPK